MVEIASFFWLDLPYTLKLIFQFYNIFIRTRITKTLTQQTHKLSANTQALSKHTSSQQTHNSTRHTTQQKQQSRHPPKSRASLSQRLSLPSRNTRVSQSPSVVALARNRSRLSQASALGVVPRLVQSGMRIASCISTPMAPSMSRSVLLTRLDAVVALLLAPPGTTTFSATSMPTVPSTRRQSRSLQPSQGVALPLVRSGMNRPALTSRPKQLYQ